MKKLPIVLALLLTSQSVSAAQLIVTYDKDMVLSGVGIYCEDKEYGIADGESAFIYDMDTGERTQYFAPAADDEPESEDKPTDEDEPDDTVVEPEEDTSLPTVYETAKDAISAFAIVTDKSQILQNDDTVWKIDVLYQAKTRELYVSDDITITSAPDAYADLAWESASSLKKGDVINITASTTGKIKGINLIMRLDGYDIINDDMDYGYDFEYLYSSGGVVKWGNESYPIHRFGKDTSGRVQYQFGLIHVKRNLYYTITNKAGKQNEIIDIGILPDTIVYVCDVGRKYEITLGNTSDITASLIPSDSFDDEGNIISWSDEGEYSYALSRTIDGFAAEVVVFTNLK